MHPWIIAHRVARDEAPENTGSALRRAVELPVDGVEFDVQMSSDGGVIESLPIDGLTQKEPRVGPLLPASGAWWAPNWSLWVIQVVLKTWWMRYVALTGW